MISEKYGKIVKGVGGLYETRTLGEDGSPERIVCRAKGSLHRDEEKLLVGDNVKITLDTETPDGISISECLPRKNALIRPPLANLDYIFIVLAAKKPAPVLETVDKLVAIAEHNEIEPVIVISKSDLADGLANEYAEIYKLAGLPVFVCSSFENNGVAELKEYIKTHVKYGKTAAFAGASGVGKSTLMNALFQGLSLATADISRKIERGRHTTRHVEVFDIENEADTGFLADTPGFSMLDFSRFDFFKIDELEYAFREFRSYRGKCRYSDCAHFGEGEEECAIMRAVSNGKVAKSRFESYRSIYKTLKAKNNYE